MKTLRVVTLNIWNRTGAWEERLRAIRAGLLDLSPDLVGLQEVLRLDPGAGDGLDQGAAIAEGLGYHVAYGRAHDETWLGNAALSRWPIERSQVFDLPRVGTDEKRSLVAADLATPYGGARFFVTHLNWRFDEGHVREAQVREIVARIEASMQAAPHGTLPAVLVGDFNAEPDADEIRYLKGLTSLGGPRRVFFQDAFARAGNGPGCTFSQRNPFAAPLREPERRIDYIFVRGPDDTARGEPLAARVCFDTPHEGSFASDHFGVIATLRVGE